MVGVERDRPDLSNGVQCSGTIEQHSDIGPTEAKNKPLPPYKWVNKECEGGLGCQVALLLVE